MNFGKIFATAFVLVLALASIPLMTADSEGATEYNEQNSIDGPDEEITYHYIRYAIYDPVESGKHGKAIALYVDEKTTGSTILKDLTIPDEIVHDETKYDVVQIREARYEGAKDLTFWDYSLKESVEYITIGKNVKWIDPYEFQGYRNVKEITFKHRYDGNRSPCHLESGCLDFNAANGDSAAGHNIMHTIHSERKWVLQYCKERPDVVGGELELETGYTFDSEVTEKDNSLYWVIAIPVVIIIGLFIWYGVSKR